MNTAVKTLKLIFLLLPTAWLVLWSCSAPKEGSSYGTVTITSDESLQPMVKQLTEAFEGIYPNAHFNVLYRPEQQAVSLMIRDSARLVFTTRLFTAQEEQFFKQEGIRYNPQPIATDGLALVIHPQNKDSLTTMSELSRLFKGQIKDWSQLKGSSRSGKITLVFDNANSSNLNFMMRTFGLTDVKNLNIFSAGSNQKVIEHIRNNPNALGFIGVNWISDGDLAQTAQLSKGVRIMGVSAKENPTSIADYFQPFQRDLGLKNYPLHRKVYVISREMTGGLGSGLINYIVRDVGSLVIEKCGLWPEKPFNREVYLQKGN
ncbi:MAG: phosphate ABC transporter substrate-binding protein [Runella slithyformis]|nr:MAG: phosphate ABC transporter substrate-binding protein [Runella slithyformis]TAE96707.1 MAG: phosphate ABC transporter substrate-binding protein [Runella slithyformis]TAF29426.1 MAG: phosphate ABC transporter substrate-binding protein [Runella slithyformis]TAF48175.1 MAG: phosphate ABC transporter substrate-binding protein [Runella slithyformis]TAF81665.1 MAG: phosphate ABC transporter substrate-binding protein [Runella slithyformis]